MFEITGKAIVADSKPTDSKVGGVVVFEGRVRNINGGEEVQSLEYEAYPALALVEGNKIMTEARERFDILEARAIHRVGHLQIGDIAVFVYTGSIHRKDAYDASIYIIDEIKKRVPIWKKEHYANGEPKWVNCHQVEPDRDE